MSEHSGKAGALPHGSHAAPTSHAPGGADRSAAPLQVRVVLPAHLQTLARVSGEVTVDVSPPVTQRSVLDALEAAYPTLRGTTRDHATRRRRPFIRFFACGEDLSNDPADAPLPDAVCSGEEPFVVLGAIAGG